MHLKEIIESQQFEEEKVQHISKIPYVEIDLDME